MALRIDKAGRVILPKPLRDRLGLHEGSRLEVVETTDGIELRPTPDLPSMIKWDGLWVHTGRAIPGLDVVQTVRDDREERIRKLAGL